MLDLTIATDPDAAKGRSFRGTLICNVVANAAWEGGKTAGKAIRPIYCAIAASDAESGPLLANLRAGRKATVHVGGREKTKTLELLRSADYEFFVQRHAEGTIVSAYLPDLYKIDLGMVDPAGIRFAMLPSRKWLGAVDERSVAHALKVFPLDAEEVAPAVDASRLFAAYLDRHTRCPLIPDPRFYAQICVAAIVAELATMSSGWGRNGTWYKEHGIEAMGHAPGICMVASHEAVETLLAEQVKIYERTV